MTLPRVTLVSALGVSRVASDEYEVPLGIITLAGILRGSYPVCVVDLDDEWFRASRVPEKFESRAVDAILASRPDIIGFSSVSGSYPLTLRLARVCKAALPRAALLLGGPQATVTDVATLQTFPFIDMILRGEADATLPALIAAMGSDIAFEAAAVPGLTYRDRGRVRRNPNAPSVENLDSLPLPAFDLISRFQDLRSYPVEVGRGCPYACTFCSTNDFFRRRFRLKSPEHVLEEMRVLNRMNPANPVTTFLFTHDMFTVDRKRVVRFCETLIAADCGFTWSCSARTDSVDSDLLRLMRDAGCRSMFFGIESGSKRMQRFIEKDLDLDVARAMLQQNSDLGVHCDASLIIGYPQETREDLRDTVKFYADAMLMPWVDPQLNIISPLAATPLTAQYEDQLVLDEDWAEISECGTLQTSVDKLLIAAHPDLFTNFYAMPYFPNRAGLRRVHNFLFYGRQRCGGLMRAVYLHRRDMLAVFEEWEQSVFSNPEGGFELLYFAYDLISFCESQYPDVPSIIATARFYREALSRAASQPKQAARADVAYLTLEERVVIVDTECDIRTVLEALARGLEPDPGAFFSPSTVVVWPGAKNRSHVQSFPAPFVELLRHAENVTPLDDIYRDFQDRSVTLPGLTPENMVAGGIQCLEEKRLVRRVFPVSDAAFQRPLSLAAG